MTPKKPTKKPAKKAAKKAAPKARPEQPAGTGDPFRLDAFGTAPEPDTAA